MTPEKGKNLVTIGQGVRLYRWRIGMEASFKVLVREFHGMLYSYVLTMVSDRHAAEDMVQEAFLTAYRKRNEFDEIKDFGAFGRDGETLEFGKMSWDELLYLRQVYPSCDIRALVPAPARDGRTRRPVEP
jgi:hypothetical protein